MPDALTFDARVPSVSRPMTHSHDFTTHRVENQTPPLRDYNAYSTDLAFVEAIQREGAAAWSTQLDTYGRLVGGDLIDLGFEANRHRPFVV